MNYQEELARLQLEDRKKKEKNGVGSIPCGCWLWAVILGWIIGGLIVFK